MKLAFYSWPFSALCCVPKKQFLHTDLYALLGLCDWWVEGSALFIGDFCQGRLPGKEGKTSVTSAALRHILNFYSNGITDKISVSCLFCSYYLCRVPVFQAGMWDVMHVGFSPLH